LETKKKSKTNGSDTGLEFKCGLMVLDIKVTGLKTKHKVEVLFGILMAICTKENSKTIKATGLVSTHVKTGQSLKACGKTMYSTEKDQLIGLMDQIIKEGM
jgi:hypothetical protein